MKILVAADGSPFTKRMLAYLAAHDEWLGSKHRYTVLNVVPPKTVMAEVTTCSCALSPRYHPFLLARSAATGSSLPVIPYSESRHMTLALGQVPMFVESQVLSVGTSFSMKK